MFGASSTSYTAQHGDAIGAAVAWLEQVLLGTVGTVVATIAMAGLGYAMLQGRLSAKQGLRVLFGCFILFGAPVIAQGIAGLGRGSSEPIAIPTPAPVPKPVQPTPKQNADPYAGASVPM